MQNIINPDRISMPFEEINRIKNCPVGEFEWYTLRYLIKSKTEPREFELYCKTNPNYKLEQRGSCGGSAMHHAVTNHNISLIEHIAKIGGTHLLDLGDEDFRTPAYYAIEHLAMNLYTAGYNREQEESGMLVVKKLIQLGANINATWKPHVYKSGKLSLNTSLKKVLETAASVSDKRFLPLIQLVVLNGARIYGSLTPTEAEKLNEAVKPLFEQWKCLCLGQKDAGSSFFSIPHDIRNLLSANHHYLLGKNH